MPQAFDTNSLEHEAMNRTGLEDFGPGDWREAMARLLEAAQAEAQLNDAGRYMLRAQVLLELGDEDGAVADWGFAHEHELEAEDFDAWLDWGEQGNLNCSTFFDTDLPAEDEDVLNMLELGQLVVMTYAEALALSLEKM